MRNYGVLSFRAGQNYLDAYNTEGQSKDFYVRLYTAAGWSNDVAVGDYAILDYPHAYLTNLSGTVPYGDYANSNMQTVRLPLSAFTNVDLEFRGARTSAVSRWLASVVGNTTRPRSQDQCGKPLACLCRSEHDPSAEPGPVR